MSGVFNSDTIKIFLAVLDSGSFSAAARHLGRVPSAVSMAMANLEAELALALFDRAGREPKPTANALALEPQARLLMGQLQQLNTQALALSQGLETRLTLVIAPELPVTPWLGPLTELARVYPLLEISIITAPQVDAIAMLHRGEAQLALVFERPTVDGRENFHEVGKETLVAVIAGEHALIEELAPGARINASQLRLVRQISVGSQQQERRQESDYALGFCLAAEHSWRVDNPVTALDLVIAGLGWGWLPRVLVQPHIQQGTVRELPLENLTNGQELWIDLVWSRERPLGLAAQRLVQLAGGKHQRRD